MCRWRFGDAGGRAKLEFESCVFLNLLARHARIEGKRRQTPCGFVKSENGEIGHYTIHSAGKKAAVVARLPALEPARTGDEIDVLYEAPFFVLQRHNHVGETGYVVASAGARQSDFRISRIADERTVEIAILINLRATHEADIDVPALEQQQHLCAAEHHVGADGATLIVS